MPHGLNSSEAAGPDLIHPKFLHELATELVGPLTTIFRKSLDSCTLPPEWKEAILCSVFKNGDRSLSSNYRPVSLTNFVIILLEKMVRDSLERH